MEMIPQLLVKWTVYSKLLLLSKSIVEKLPAKFRTGSNVIHTQNLGKLEPRCITDL